MTPGSPPDQMPVPTSPSRRRPLGAIVTAAVVIMVASVAFAGAARAASTSTWAFAPYSPPGSTVQRGFFDYSLNAGQSITDKVVLKNYSDQTLTADVYASDATNVPNGGAFTPLLRTQTMHTVGLWVHSSVTTVSVPPRTEDIFPFTLSIPAGTPPGDYAGAIVAVDQQQSVQRQGPIDVAVNQALGARIYLHVNGKTRAGLIVTDLNVTTHPRSSWSWLSGSRTGVARIGIVNTGNTIFQSVDATLTLTDTFGARLATVHVAPVEVLLPGSHIEITVPVRNLPNWGIFDVRARLAVTGGHATSVVATTKVWNVPWWLVAVVAVLIIGLLVWRILRRPKRRRRRGGPRAVPEVGATADDPAESEAAPNDASRDPGDPAGDDEGGTGRSRRRSHQRVPEVPVDAEDG